jgi:hypothetical protein
MIVRRYVSFVVPFKVSRKRFWWDQTPAKDLRSENNHNLGSLEALLLDYSQLTVKQPEENVMLCTIKFGVRLDARGLESWRKTLDGKLPNERRAPSLHESGSKVDECLHWVLFN